MQRKKLEEGGGFDWSGGILLKHAEAGAQAARHFGLLDDIHERRKLHSSQYTVKKQADAADNNAGSYVSLDISYFSFRLGANLITQLEKMQKKLFLLLECL